MRKRIFSLILAAVLLSIPVLSVSAHEVPDLTRRGSVAISMSYRGQPIPGGTLTVLRVAEVKTAPCRFSGSVFTGDLVLMAHNYKKHFGPIRRLKAGDPVTFTDMDGVAWEYRVVAQEILDSGAVEDVTGGEYDLTLFTCTYGGENRITVRCDRVEK